MARVLFFVANLVHDLGSTLNSAYNEVTFNEKLAITKENVCTKYTTYTYKYIALNQKLPIMKQNLHIFFLLQVELSVSGKVD